jgi:hypothetical protein
VDSFLICNANPACSCVYICKFQFRPIHPPLGDYHKPLVDPVMKEALDIMSVANSIVDEVVDKLLNEAVEKILKED